MLCESCDCVTINGMICHEFGCPDKWMTEERECKWCGTVFSPDYREQYFCDETCQESCCN